MKTASRTRSSRSALLAPVFAAVLLLAGCGETGGDDAATTTEATSPDESTTTTGDETTTTEDGATTTTESSGGDVSIEDLEALLPEADEIRAGYTVQQPDDDDDDDENPADAAIQDACPDAADFFDDQGDDDPKAEREFADAMDRSISVGLDPTPRNLGADVLDEVIDVVNGCGTITYDQDGFDVSADISAERDDTYGDRGVVMSMSITMEHPQLPAPLQLDMMSHIFVMGSVSVNVEATDGVDDDAMQAVDGDFDLIPELAALMEERVATL